MLARMAKESKPKPQSGSARVHKNHTAERHGGITNISPPVYEHFEGLNNELKDMGRMASALLAAIMAAQRKGNNMPYLWAAEIGKRLAKLPKTTEPPGWVHGLDAALTEALRGVYPTDPTQ